MTLFRQPETQTLKTLKYLPEVAFFRVNENFIQTTAKPMLCVHEKLQSVLSSCKRFYRPKLKRGIYMAYLAASVLELI